MDHYQIAGEPRAEVAPAVAAADLAGNLTVSWEAQSQETPLKTHLERQRCESFDWFAGVRKKTAVSGGFEIVSDRLIDGVCA